MAAVLIPIGIKLLGTNNLEKTKTAAVFQTPVNNNNEKAENINNSLNNDNNDKGFIKKNTVYNKGVNNKLNDLERGVTVKKKQDDLKINKRAIIVEFNNEEDNISKAGKTQSIFDADNYEGCAPLDVKFLNKSINAESFVWNFGNKKSSVKNNPEIIYEIPGEYTVSLTVYTGGVAHTTKKYITVFEKPLVEFIVPQRNNLFADEEVTFANLSTNVEKCCWDFGDNIISYDRHPRHIFKRKGIYDIKLTAYSKAGCPDSSFNYSVSVKDSKYIIVAPTGVVANKSGQNDGYWQANSKRNDIFRMNFRYDVAEYNLLIYNRYGQLVFKSNDIHRGWNAYYKNKIAPVDVYVWECSGKFIDGKVFYKTGNVTVVHADR